MGRCFVIQPFDKGAFDQRYDDVLAPAIKAADLEPYRVDLDPSVSIPIQSIEDGIQHSEVCLADITLDNPNVWFEVGYAIAARKEVVFICAEDRKAPFPFDVQHRTITTYATTSRRDFNELEQKITRRLKAILQVDQELAAVSQLSPTQETEGLTPHEVAVLVILMENRLSPDASSRPDYVAKRMRQSGFTDIAVSLALNSLHSKGYIKYVEHSDDFGNQYYTCAIDENGLRWIQDNQSALVMRVKDDDIPF